MPPQLERGLAGRDRGFIWAGAWWCGLMTEQPPEPNGLVYQPDFLTQAEEQEVLDVLKAMEFHPITMHGQTARRTVRHFSLGYGYASWKLEPTDPLPHNLGAGCVRRLGERLPRRHGPLRPGRLPAPRRHRAAAQPHRPDPTVPGTGTHRPDQGSGRQRRPTPPHTEPATAAPVPACRCIPDAPVEPAGPAAAGTSARHLIPANPDRVMHGGQRAAASGRPPVPATTHRARGADRRGQEVRHGR